MFDECTHTNTDADRTCVVRPTDASHYYYKHKMREYKNRILCQRRQNCLSLSNFVVVATALPSYHNRGIAVSCSENWSAQTTTIISSEPNDTFYFARFTEYIFSLEMRERERESVKERKILKTCLNPFANISFYLFIWNCKQQIISKYMTLLHPLPIGHRYHIFISIFVSFFLFLKKYKRRRPHTSTT